MSVTPERFRWSNGMTIDWTLVAALGVLYAVAIADVCLSRLSVGAKILWVVMLIYLVGIGMVAWLLTRHSAHQWVGIAPSSDASVGGGGLT